MLDLMFLRVSKEEKNLQDIEPQKIKLCQKYSLDIKKCIVLEERGSAYNIDKLHKRTAFLRLLEILFDANNMSIMDIFLRRLPKIKIRLFIWDYHRIMRNFEFSLLFGLLTDLCNIEIYSYKQGYIKRKEEEMPIDKFSRYIFYSINAFSSEDYSYHISKNVKKTIHVKNNITVSSKGNKWGRRFKNNQGKRVQVSPKVVDQINKRISYLISYYKKNKKDNFYILIIEKIRKEFAIDISKAYITKVRHK